MSLTVQTMAAIVGRMAATTTHPDTDHRCPIDPELADLIPDLMARDVGIQLVPAEAVPHKCEACLESTPDRTADADVWVCHRSPGADPEGFVYREPACALHLVPVTAWLLRAGVRGVWVEISAGGTRA